TRSSDGAASACPAYRERNRWASKRVTSRKPGRPSKTLPSSGSGPGPKALKTPNPGIATSMLMWRTALIGPGIEVRQQAAQCGGLGQPRVGDIDHHAVPLLEQVDQPGQRQ